MSSRTVVSPEIAASAEGAGGAAVQCAADDHAEAGRTGHRHGSGSGWNDHHGEVRGQRGRSREGEGLTRVRDLEWKNLKREYRSLEQ